MAACGLMAMPRMAEILPVGGKLLALEGVAMHVSHFFWAYASG